MPSDDYIAGLIAEFSELLEPLSDALASEAAFRELLRSMGWELEANADMNAVAGAFSGVTGPAGSLAGDVAQGKDLDVLAGDVAAVASSLVAAGAAAAPGLPQPLGQQAFWSSLPDDLLELLVYTHLERHHAFVFGALTFAGALRLDPQQADPASGRLEYERMTLDLDRLGKTISAPQNLMRDVYGWGTQFDHARFMRALGALLAGFRSVAEVYPAPEPLLDAFYDAANESRVEVDAVVASPPQLAVGNAGAFLKPSLVLMPVPPPSDPTAKPDELVLLPYVTGGVAASVQLTDVAELELQGEFGTDLLDIFIAPGGVHIEIGGAAAQLGASAQVNIAQTPPIVVAGDPASTRLELWAAHLKLAASGSPGSFEVEAEAAIDQMKLVLDFGEGDGFLQKVIGGSPQSIDLAPGVAWSSSHGFRFMGETRLELELPVHVDIAGVIFIETIYLEIGGDPAGKVDVELAVTGGLALGPVSASVERVGIVAAIGGADAANPGNLGPVDVDFGFKLPDGVGMEVDAAVVKGGGFIGHKDDEYDGLLELAVEDVIQLKVIGILNTKLPDGSPGFSLLLIITAEFEPIQLGWGFTLNGVGGLAGINRTMVVDVLRAGIKNKAVDSIMFPPDPVGNAPQIISNLRAIFPPADGRYVFGPMVELGWGTPSLIIAEIGVLLELPAPVRIVILGQIRTVLPDEHAAVVSVHLDSIGIIELEKKTLSVDATIYDSEIAGAALSGDMALRLAWGDAPNFALSLGGLNPRYQPPAGFPTLDRLTLQLGSGDNPRITADAYLAVTANSAQIGSHLSLHAEAGGFSVDGHLGFDALFLFVPAFSMVAEMHAAVQLLHGSSALMTVRVDFVLSGPHPWHAQGSASAHVLFTDVSVSFDCEWGDPTVVAAAPLDAKQPLLDALADARNWSAALPDGAERAVTLGDMPADQGSLLIHPMGRLTVRQRVAPLDYTLSLFGTAAPAGANRFSIGKASIGPAGGGAASEVAKDDVSDEFPVGQFTALTQDEQVTRASYEPFHSGVSAGSDETTAGHVSTLEVHYETTLIDHAGGSQPGDLYALGADKLVLAAQSAAGVSKVLATGSGKFAEPGTRSAVSVDGVKHVITRTDDLSISGVVDAAGTTAAAAHEALGRHLAEHPEDAGALQVMPVHEALVA